MGSLLSKSSPSAAQAAKRQYPKRPPPPPPPSTTARASQPQPSAQPPPHPHPATKAPPSSPRTRQTPPASPSKPPPDSDPLPEGFDPSLAARLQRLGPVQPSPTLSNTSAFSVDPTKALAPAAPGGSPALRILAARRRLAERAEAEGRAAAAAEAREARRRWREERGEEVEDEDREEGESFGGREFLDVGLIRRVLVMREKGVAMGEIERSLGLRTGVVGRLGPRAMVGTVGGG